MTVAAHPDILSFLQSIQKDVERKFASLDRFRALKAIEQTIADFPGLDDLARSLSDIRDQMRGKLDETREFRALRSIERIMPELSEVLALLEYNPATSDSEQPGDEATVEGAAVLADPAPDPAQEAVVTAGAAADAGSMSTASAMPAVAQPAALAVESADGPSGIATEEGPDMRRRLLQSDATLSGADAELVPSLADSVAQLMAQSMAPPRETYAPPATHAQEHDDTSRTHAERAA